MSIRILQGDCIERMRELAENSVDSVVVDGPYGIRFMGKAWDGADIEARAEARAEARRNCPSKHEASGPNGAHNSIAAEAGKYARSPSAMRAFQEFSEEWAREALRVLKPGGYLLSFASPRTYHRMASGIEDAGFEVRDQILWVFGSGFPKSHNGEWGGTALKPAHEPIVVARKPLEGTVEENWRKWGTGALNIEGCRIATKDDLNGGAYSDNGARASSQSLNSGGMNRAGATAGGEFVQPVGRWPANIIHDGSDEVLAAFPDAPGQMADASASASARKNQNTYGAMRRGNGSENAGQVGFKMKPGTRRLDSGSAARFFYCAKADKADRDEGLDGMPARQQDASRKVDDPGGDNPRNRGAKGRTNHHPTVKPTDLMRYLIRLVTPAGGIVLDPFAGSGSTLKAADLEGFSAIGIEIDPAYVEIARRRIAADTPLLANVEVS